MTRQMLMLFLLGMAAVQANAGDIPEVVVQYASSFAQAQAPDRKVALDLAMVNEYAQWFFSGFTNPDPNRGAYNIPPAIHDAYMRGKAYWREHPGERAKIFAGYGYTAVDVDGTWSKSFEKSSFEPATLAGAKWWMKPLGDVPWSEVGIDQGRENGVSRVHITGYLSPAGHYGHAGAYEHEVLVTAGTRVDSGNH